MDQQLFERICNVPGIPGFEDAAQEVVREALKGFCDEIQQDRLGNLIGVKKASQAPGNAERPLRVLLAAHVDEIGMMVKHIDEGGGYVRFQPVGGLHSSVLVSQPVIIHGKEPVNGIIVPNTNNNLPAPQDLIIDTAMPGDRLGQLIEIGDMITFAQKTFRMNDKVYAGRNFDDRVGTYCMVEAMRGLGPTSVDVYAVSTVQEEVGVRGMPAAAYAIDPDIGVAIDGGVTTDPNHGKPERLCEMGKGAAIYLMDGLTISDRRLARFLIELCERFDICFQRNIGGGTDASAIQRSKAGALAATVGAPVRYMHSTVQLCHVDDIEATVDLLRVFLEHAHELGAAALPSKEKCPA